MVNQNWNRFYVYDRSKLGAPDGLDFFATSVVRLYLNYTGEVLKLIVLKDSDYSNLGHEDLGLVVKGKILGQFVSLVIIFGCDRNVFV